MSHPQKSITGQVKITFLPKENLLGKKVAEIFCDKQSADTDRSKVQIFQQFLVFENIKNFAPQRLFLSGMSGA